MWSVCRDVWAREAYVRKEGREEGIKASVQMCRTFGVLREEAQKELQEKFHISKAEAEKYIEEYWEA